jgi:hypothetical protein
VSKTEKERAERIAAIKSINQIFGKSQFGLALESDATEGAWRQQNLFHLRVLTPYAIR